MKKFFILFLTLILTSSFANAKSFKMLVEVIGDVDVNNPPKTVKTRLVQEKIFNENQTLEEGCIFEGKIVDVVEAKRGKRNEYFYYQITSLTRPSTAETITINNENAIVKATAYKELDKKEIAFSAGTTVAGLFVDHIAVPVNFVRGAIEQPYENTSRMKSGVRKAYEKSFLSFFSKGKEMQLENGTRLTLTARLKSNDDKENE